MRICMCLRPTVATCKESAVAAYFVASYLACVSFTLDRQSFLFLSLVGQMVSTYILIWYLRRNLSVSRSSRGVFVFGTFLGRVVFWHTPERVSPPSPQVCCPTPPPRPNTCLFKVKRKLISDLQNFDIAQAQCRLQYDRDFVLDAITEAWVSLFLCLKRWGTLPTPPGIFASSPNHGNLSSCGGSSPCISHSPPKTAPRHPRT